MYKTKKEVDAHVRTALSKLRTEQERQLRSFTIAKLYYKINEYSSAEQYLLSHLTVKEDNDQAHKLLGQCYQRLKKPEKALQSFQRSLQLNSKQPDLLIEVCQLLLDDKNLNTTTAKYWCELAESEKVQHDAVFSLRLKLMNRENLDMNQVEELIQKEIVARPNEVPLRVRLVRNFIEQNKVVEAFKYAYNIEMNGNDIFTSSGEWYSIVWLTLNKYEQLPNIKKDWDFWLLLIICLERQVNLSFTHSVGAINGGVTETANLLFNFDQYLYKASQLADKFCAQKELVSVFLGHYRGQLLLHSSALILKREILQNKNRWKETINSILPLLLLAYQNSPLSESKEPWMKHSNEQGKQLIQLWYNEGSFRCAQAGRTLLSCIADETADKENATIQINNIFGKQSKLWTNSDDLLAQIRQTCSDKQWRRNLFAMLFCNSDHKIKEHSSYFTKCPKLNEPQYELPSYADVESYEEQAQYHKPHSLQHMVYLCLGNDNLSYVRAKYFNGLNFSIQNLAFCGAESLNQLDMDTFLYATTIQAKRMCEVERQTYDNYNTDSLNSLGKPRILPFVNMQAQLCTEEQINWWLAAYQVYKNLSNDNLAELRSNLQFGIEAVRGINGPKMDIIIAFKLGQIFVARTQDIVKPVEKAFLEARAESIYKYGLNMVKMHNRAVLEPFRKYFKYPKSNTSAVEREISDAAEDAVTFLASRFFKKSEYEELIAELSGIQLPFATYMQAEAYRKLDEANKTPKKVKRVYLENAIDCLNQTISLLKNTQTDPNHPLNSIIHSELKRVQQTISRYCVDSPNYNSNTFLTHNNSSTYEDAEADFFAASPIQTNFSRSRRDAAVAPSAPSRNLEMENLVKQMATTLVLVKEEIVDTIKPEVVSMRKEITSLKDKIMNLEEAMKKTRISSNPPSRDDASNVLDDLYMIEDALQNQLCQHTPHTYLPPSSQPQSHNVLYQVNAYNTPGSQTAHSQGQQLQQLPQTHCQRLHTPSTTAMHMQHNAAAVAVAAAAYNNPIFNPNYPMNYYSSPFMMPPPQGISTPTNILGQRTGPMAVNYLDGVGGMNFNGAPNAPMLSQPSVQDQQRTSGNLYSLLTQQPPVPSPQQQQQQQQQFTSQQNAFLHFHAPPAVAQPPVSASVPPTSLPVTQVPTLTTPAVTSATGVVSTSSLLQFNKTINNQPVEKGPPANVVITNSDPLPNRNTGPLQTQQPTLSVTIPTHHIKSSAAVTSNQTVVTTSIQTSNVFSTFTLSTSFGNSPFGGLMSNSAPKSTSITSSIFNNNNVTSSVSNSAGGSNTVSSSTFSFKPQIEAQAAAKLNEETLHKTADSSTKSEQDRSGGASDLDIEYDPRPDFKPIIPLPAEIEVKTGEEDEEVKFCHRAKLYRFLDKDWKERGIGDIKILKNKDGTSRILMRRDQTHKICANHKITAQLQLTTPRNETKGHIWIANDFADEEIKLETFFVRFKLAETAQQFAEAFKQAQTEDKNRNTQSGLSTQASVDSKDKAKPVKFGLAKSAATNFVTSTPTSKGAATSSKPSSEKHQLPEITKSTTVTANKTTTNAKSLFTVATTSAPSTNPLAISTQSKPTSTGSSPFANFTFDKTSSASSQAPTSSAQTYATSTTSGFGNLFSNLGKYQSQQSPFSTANLPKSFATVVKSSPPETAPDSSQNKSGTSDAAEDDYVPTAQFNPAIPLPDLIDVTTGEENEIVLYEHRAKLLRFDKEAGEWKERGIGNIKVLQNKEDSNKVRLVMRREQIHKLCCNQRLYKDTAFKYAKNSETAVTWAGQDFSENELVTEMLTLRFKTPDICRQFLAAINKAQTEMSPETIEKQINEGEDKKLEKKDNKLSSVKQQSLQEAKPKSFGDEFKPKPGTWSCQACYIQNGPHDQYCVACDSPKDSTVPKKESSLLISNTQNTFKLGTFKFGNNAAGGDASNDPKTVFGFSSSLATGAVSFNPTTSSAPTSIASATVKEKIATKATTIGGSAPSELTTSTLPSIAVVAPTSPATSSATSSGQISQPPPETATTLAGFGDKFKPAPGSWNCEACYVSNKSDANYCSACESPKDSTVPKKDPTSNILKLSNVTSKFNFGFSSTNDENKSIPSTTGGFSFGTKSTSAQQNFNFTSSAPITASTSATNPSISKPVFSFSLQSSAISTPVIPTADRLATVAPLKQAKSPAKGGSVGDDGGDDGDDSSHHIEEEENNAYFTPVIPLPDKIVVKTGEEDEEVLYVHRAKLYRFVEGEWKERGLGDVKILRHKVTKKLRVVMRREQIFKLCLNHVLNEEVVYKPKDEKSWCFVVNDFSEGEVELQQFSLRFKNKDIADGFMDAIRKALVGTSKPIENQSDTLATTTETTPIGTLNTSATLSNNDKKSIEALKLPNDFYESKPPCPGCRGCDADKFIFAAPKSNESFINPDDIKNPLKPMELPKLTPVMPKRPILKQSALLASLPATQQQQSKENERNGSSTTAVDMTKASGDGNNTNIGANVTAPVRQAFSFMDALNKSNLEESKPQNSIFGGSLFGGDNKLPVFGSTPTIFDSSNKNSNLAKNTEKPVSIFGNGSENIGSASPASGGSLFSGKPTFGASLKAGDDTKPIFGGSSIGQSGSVGFRTGSSIFGLNFSSFGTAADNKSNTTQSIFSNANKPNIASMGNNNSQTVPTFVDLSKKSGDLDFASLAAKAKDAPKENVEKATPGPGGFIGLTNMNAFSSFQKCNNKNNSSNTSHINESGASVNDDACGGTDENYDPHYEPIIALPNEIVVSTGEEEETKLFGERATLFRWDSVNKEWKERGVGEMKILMHPIHQKYRMVMRREQIHKLVLNFAISSDFTYTNMNNNPKSLVWAGMNYAESTSGELEKLAVRFKKLEIAEEFASHLKRCIESAKKRDEEKEAQN